MGLGKSVIDYKKKTHPKGFASEHPLLYDLYPNKKPKAPPSCTLFTPLTTTTTTAAASSQQRSQSQSEQEYMNMNMNSEFRFLIGWYRDDELVGFHWAFDCNKKTCLLLNMDRE